MVNCYYSEIVKFGFHYWTGKDLAKVLKVLASINRSNRLQIFFKLVILKNFSNSTGMHLCWSLFLRKFYRPEDNFIVKRIQHRCFLVKFAKFWRITFLTENLRRLLLHKTCWGTRGKQGKRFSVNCCMTLEHDSMHFIVSITISFYGYLTLNFVRNDTLAFLAQLYFGCCKNW